METVSEHCEAERLTSSSSTPPPKESSQELTKLKCIRVSVPQPSSRSRSSSDGKIRPIGTGRSRSSSGRGSTTSLGGGEGIIWTEAELYLTHKMLCYDVQGRTLEVLLEDLIGVQIKPSPPPNKDSACEVSVFYFPFITKRNATTKVRRVITLSVMFDEKDDFKDNLATADEWKAAILIQTQRAARCAFEQVDNGGSEEDSVISRTLLVLINPMAGAQKGESLFKNHVKPMFDSADICCKIVITERQNHARELIKTYDFSEIDGIVITSGDGLLYEVINGIMERDDWETTIKTPMGILPTGSGNALAASTLYESGESVVDVETAAFQIIRGGLVAGDIATIQLSDNTFRYMALLGCWGFIADVDIESEKFRKIGELRFVLGMIASVVKKKIYTGNLSYLPANKKPEVVESNDDKEKNVGVSENHVDQAATEDSTTADQDIAIDQKDATECNNGTATDNVEQAATAESASSSQDVPIDSEVVDKDANEITTTADQDTTMDELVDKDAIEGNSGVTTNNTNADTDDEQEVKSKESVSKKNHGPPTDLLVPLTEKVPNSWIPKGESFFGISILMIPMIGKDVFGNRHLKIGSGFFRIMCIAGDISRVGAVKMITSADTGKHTDMDEVTSVDAKAFRLEPTTPGIFTLDGEAVPYGPVQGQIHPGLLRIMSRRRKN